MRLFPVSPRLTTGSIPFGAPDPNAMFGKHAGIDSANSVGTMIVAPCDGTVTSYTYGQYHGKVVQIKAADGTYPHMFHCSELLLTPGMPVRTGQPVAKSGATGQNISGPLNPNCHFGVSMVSVEKVTSFDQFINPDEWLKEGESMTQDQAERLVSWAYRSTNDIDPTPDQAGYWVPRVKDNPEEIISLLQGLCDTTYKGDPAFRTKARNYDKDLAAASGGYVETKVFTKKEK